MGAGEAALPQPHPLALSFPTLSLPGPAFLLKHVCNDNFGDNVLKFQLHNRIKPKSSYLFIVRKAYTIVRNKGECQ